jgi:hypothetical protein
MNTDDDNLLRNESDTLVRPLKVRIPLWVKLSIILITLSTVTTSVSFITLVVKSGPILNNISSQIFNVIHNLNIEDLNDAIKKAIIVINYLCDNIIECNGNIV